MSKYKDMFQVSAKLLDFESALNSKEISKEKLADILQQMDEVKTFVNQLAQQKSGLFGGRSSYQDPETLSISNRIKRIENILNIEYKNMEQIALATSSLEETLHNTPLSSDNIDQISEQLKSIVNSTSVITGVNEHAFVAKMKFTFNDWPIIQQVNRLISHVNSFREQQPVFSPTPK